MRSRWNLPQFWVVALGIWAPALRGQEVVVESADRAAEKSREASKFLTRPDEAADSYAAPVNWREVPPWRQTAFYGVRSQGTFFIFVIDCSGSMADEERWLRVIEEMRRTLASLQFPQRYYVILYNDRPVAMPGGLPQSASKQATGRTLDWVSRVVPEGATDPRAAMAEALALRPHAVYLLSDGEFPEGTAETVAKGNSGRVPVHCIDLGGAGGAAALKQIARDSGGRYVAR
jgi:hypothetical protein